MDPQHSLAGQVDDQNGGLCNLGWAAYMIFEHRQGAKQDTR